MSVGLATVGSNSTSVMFLVDEVAVMLVALPMLRDVPDAGVIVTLEAATCVYPVKSKTGAGADVVVDEIGLEALIGASPVPPVSQWKTCCQAAVLCVSPRSRGPFTNAV